MTKAKVLPSTSNEAIQHKHSQMATRSLGPINGRWVLAIGALLWGLALCFGLVTLAAPQPEHQLSLVSQVWVDDDYQASTAGWGSDHFDSLEAGLAAVAEGGHIYIADGQYQGTHTLDKHGVQLLGDGVPAAHIVLHGNGSDTTLLITANSVSVRGVTITGGAVQGIRIAASAQDTVIADCIINGNGCAGICVVGGSGHVLDNNQIESNQSTGVSLGIVASAASNVLIKSNTIFHHHDTLGQGAGILIESTSSNVLLTNNTVADNDFGIRAANCISVTIASNKVGTSSYSGIHVQDSSAVRIMSNQVGENAGSGIMMVGPSEEVSAAAPATIHDNVCQDNLAAGIYLRGAYHVSLSNNRCQTNAMHGLAVESSHITITANSLISNTLAGLRVYALDPNSSQPLTHIVAHGNRLANNGLYAVNSEMPSTLDATANWWGNNAPNTSLDIIGNVAIAPIMKLAISAEPDRIPIEGGQTRLAAHIGGGGYKIVDGVPVTFESDAGEWLSNQITTTVGGGAAAILAAPDTIGLGTIAAIVDGERLATYVEFYDAQASPLTLTLSASPRPVCAGYNLTLNIACQTTGELHASNIWITSTVPEGTWALLEESSDGAIYDPQQGLVSWAIGDLAPGSIKTLYLKLHTATTLADGDILISTTKSSSESFNPIHASIDIPVAICATATSTPTQTPSPSLTPTPIPTSTPTQQPTHTSTPTITPWATITPTPGSITMGSLEGSIWLDKNHNGQHDIEDATLSDVTLELRYAQATSSQQPASRVNTGMDGTYRFELEPHIRYRVSVIPPQGYFSVADDWSGELSSGQVETYDWSLERYHTLALPSIQK